MNIEKYNAYDMPLSTNKELRLVQQKILNDTELTIAEKRIAGRDHPIKNIEGYNLKPDCVYRAISEDLYNMYCETGYIYGYSKDDEYIEYIQGNQVYNNNKGVDWYLGGVCLKYGPVIIECEANKQYFTPASDNGCKMSFDPTVRHMKSSGYKNPVPMSMVRVIKHPYINEIDNEEKSR